MTTSGIALENSRPEWQRWLNQFCENWIFAFLVAMAIRHFCLEAFRIPTASMEPMLYGDPGILKGDHVVVDKLTPRFTGYSRWDVTVFQFPRPELEHGDGARPALTANGDRLDNRFLRPLFCRNFVKRTVAVPGDVFYFAGGDLHLKQADGSFAVARKPAAIQEALWQDIWIQGAQAGYLPWAASGTSTVTGSGEIVNFTLGDQPVLFTQPLRNVYVKPGPVRATHLPQQDDGGIVEVGMTTPVFTQGGKIGNLWDLENWRIERLTAKDLDHGHGTALNDVMDEWVGDVRLSGNIQALSGSAVIHLAQGAVGQPGAHEYRLELAATGWRLTGDGQTLASGSASPVGRLVQFGHLDSQLVVSFDGQEAVRVDVPDTDPLALRLRLGVSGSGTLALVGAKLQRDVHYCSRGVLRAELEQWLKAEREKGLPEAFAADQAAENQRLMQLVREQMRGRPVTTLREKTERWGVSPETAVTVPPGCYLLLGDNSPFSWDGRYWGWVPEENLRGRALLVMFPPQRWRIVR